MRHVLKGLGSLLAAAWVAATPIPVGAEPDDGRISIAETPSPALRPATVTLPPGTAARYAQGAAPFRPASPLRIIDEPRVIIPTVTPQTAGPVGARSRPAPPPPGAKILWPPIAGHEGPQVSQLDRVIDRPPWISEARLGLMAHDVGLFGRTEEDGFDFNFELLFQSPNWLGLIGGPRPHLGATVNSSGDTSLFYAGLTWTAQFSGGVFFEASLGAALHDGVEEDARAKQKELGCAVLARFSAAIGYLIDGGPHSLSLAVERADNLGTCTPNEGLDNVGLRYGFRF
jgi:lipid A 3-O-deacylase